MDLHHSSVATLQWQPTYKIEEDWQQTLAQGESSLAKRKKKKKYIYERKKQKENAYSVFSFVKGGKDKFNMEKYNKHSARGPRPTPTVVHHVDTQLLI